MVLGMRQPSNLEKKLLIRYNKFKALEEIPEYVSSETIRKVRTLYRLRIATIFTFGSLFGALAYGKAAEYIWAKRREEEAKNEN